MILIPHGSGHQNRRHHLDRLVRPGCGVSPLGAHRKPFAIIAVRSASHLPVDDHRLNFGMGGPFDPRVFTGQTEHHGDHVVAKRDDALRVFSAGAGNIDLSMHEDVYVAGLVRSHSATSETSSEESAGWRKAQVREGIEQLPAYLTARASS